MKQKVVVARALIHDPPVLLLDEAASGLDVLARRTLLDLVLALRSRERLILDSTHVMSEVEELCDRVAVISGGEVLKVGHGGRAGCRVGRAHSGAGLLSAAVRAESGGAGGCRVASVWTVARQELLATLRDRRTLSSTVLVPLLMIPLFTVGLPLLFGTLFGGQAQTRQTVGVVGSLPPR